MSWPDIPRWTTRARSASAWRWKTRYLPRRSTAVTVAPASGSSRSRRRRWRRMTRMAFLVFRTSDEALRDVVADVLGEQLGDDPPGGLHPLVEVDGADERLEGIGQDGRLLPAPRQLLTPAEVEVGPQTQFTGDIGEHAHIDGGSP